MIYSDLFRNYAYVILPLGCIYPKIPLRAQYIRLYYASLGVYTSQNMCFPWRVYTLKNLSKLNMYAHFVLPLGCIYPKVSLKAQYIRLLYYTIED